MDKYLIKPPTIPTIVESQFKHCITPEGLVYVRDLITSEEERKLIHLIDNRKWSSELHRRVQHYGFKYDFKSKSINHDSNVDPIPDFVTPIIDRIMEFFPHELERPDQIIVNEYQPGQGIGAHTDHVKYFGGEIVTLSLGSPCVMEFRHNSKFQQQISECVLSPRSLVLLKGPSRYDWTHSIPARKSDNVRGIVTKRSRRISLTFRKVVQQ